MAQSKGTGAKITAAVLIGLGVFMLVVAIMLPTYTKSKAMKTPLDLEVATVATGEANILDASSLLSGTPEVAENVPVEARRHVVVVDPTDRDQISVEAAQRVLRMDKPAPSGDAAIDERLVNATVDNITLDRVTSEPIEGTGSIRTSHDDEAPTPLPREGLQYKFPFEVEKRSYDYFDLTSRTTNEIEYVGEDKIDGMTVYHFSQNVGPVDLQEAVGGVGNEVTVPASAIGLAPEPAGDEESEGAEGEQDAEAPAEDGEEATEGDEAEEADEPEVTVTRYYTNERNLYVEPTTGVIVRGSEKIHQYFAETADAPEANRIDALNVTNPEGLMFDQETIDFQVEQAEDGISQIRLLTRIVPIVLGVVGVIFIVGGLLWGTRAGGRRETPPAAQA